MGEFKRLSIELPDEMAEAVRARVASGRYASESEVIQAGLMALAEEEAPFDEDVERWLRTEVVAAYDAWKAGRSPGKSIEEVRAALEAEHERALRDE